MRNRSASNSPARISYSGKVRSIIASVQPLSNFFFFCHSLLTIITGGSFTCVMVEGKIILLNNVKSRLQVVVVRICSR